MVNEAFRQLNTPRKRPVILEIAPTVFSAVDEVQLLEPETITARSGGLRVKPTKAFSPSI